jgi:hypothetical protein
VTPTALTFATVSATVFETVVNGLPFPSEYVAATALEMTVPPGVAAPTPLTIEMERVTAEMTGHAKRNMFMV